MTAPNKKQHQILKTHFPNLDFKENFPLSEVAYFKVGGPAQLAVMINDRKSLIDLVKFCNKEGIEFLVLGGASNVIISDRGVGKLIIFTKNDSIQLMGSGGGLVDGVEDIDEAGKENVHQTQEKRLLLRADCGLRTSALVKKSVDFGLTGLEPFMGVPGRLGGAIYNNSHFQEWLIGDYVTQVEVIDFNNQVRWIPQQECDFSYDHSRFQDTKEIILQAEFVLSEGDQELSSEIIAKTMEYRVQTQPLGMPSSGCIFKNVPNTPQLKEKFPQYSDRKFVSAGFLIDQAGLKGLSSGDIQVSSKHAAFMVNNGQGTAKDIKRLIEKVKQEVLTQFGVQLEEEVFWLE